MAGKHDSPTTTFNHPDYTVAKSSCRWCGADILEARKKVNFARVGKRTECYQCLERWWRFESQSRQLLGATNETTKEKTN